MTLDSSLEPLLVFEIRVPAGMFVDATVLVEGTVSRDASRRWVLSGDAIAVGPGNRPSGAFSIGWRSTTNTVHCRFTAFIDGLENFSYHDKVADVDAQVLRSRGAGKLEIARALLASAESFEPSLPTVVTKSHPYMTQVLPRAVTDPGAIQAKRSGWTSTCS